MIVGERGRELAKARWVVGVVVLLMAPIRILLRP